MGLRKSLPELNAAADITKSLTHSVTAAASTLIYQKNYVDGNSGGKGARTKHYDVLEVTIPGKQGCPGGERLPITKFTRCREQSATAV